MSPVRFAVLAALTACGGSTASPASTAETGRAEATATISDPVARERSSCRVVVDEEGAESRTAEYSFTGGVLEEVVILDGVTGRRFTTRFVWDDARRVVQVEKLAEGQEARAGVVMRYEGSRADGEITGEFVRDEAVLERITWRFDDAGRPIQKDHAWFPSPEDRAEGREGRMESDMCIYDDSGRPTTFELSLEGEAVLAVFYRYEGDGPYPSSIVEKHIAGPDLPARDNSIASVDMSPRVRVTWPGDGAVRTTRYEGDCEAVFFPAVCSPNAAPPL